MPSLAFSLALTACAYFGVGWVVVEILSTSDAFQNTARTARDLWPQSFDRGVNLGRSTPAIRAAVLALWPAIPLLMWLTDRARRRFERVLAHLESADPWETACMCRACCSFRQQTSHAFTSPALDDTGPIA